MPPPALRGDSPGRSGRANPGGAVLTGRPPAAVGRGQGGVLFARYGHPARGARRSRSVGPGGYCGGRGRRAGGEPGELAQCPDA
eukprot:3739465-Alexandrium_andersonii.AAC.1